MGRLPLCSEPPYLSQPPRPWDRLCFSARLSRRPRLSGYHAFKWVCPTGRCPHPLASGPVFSLWRLPLWGFYAPSILRGHFFPWLR